MEIPYPFLKVTWFPGRKCGHRQPESAVATCIRQVLALPVLMILTAAGMVGCSGTDSEEFETISAADIVTAKQSAAAQPLSGSTGRIEQQAAGSEGGPDTSTDAGSDGDPRSGLPAEGSTSDVSASPAAGPDTTDPASGTSADQENGQEKDGSPGDAVADLPDQEPAVEEPRKVKLLIPEKNFREEGREKALRVSFDDIDLLKVLNMEPVQADAPDLMPDWLKGLEGRRIRIRGFMYPTFQDTDIKVFILARDNQICCFGRSPKVYDLIKISMQEGRTTDYIPNRPFDLIGTFHIAEKAETAEDALPRLYSIDDAVIISR